MSLIPIGAVLLPGITSAFAFIGAGYGRPLNIVDTGIMNVLLTGFIGLFITPFQPLLQTSGPWLCSRPPFCLA